MGAEVRRPVAVWIVSAFVGGLLLFDVVGPAAMYGRPISTSVAQWLLWVLHLIGLVGFWRMRWWGVALIALQMTVNFILMTMPMLDEPDVLPLALAINAAVTLIWVIPVLLVALLYRKRFSLKWW